MQTPPETEHVRYARKLRPGQRAQLHVLDIESQRSRAVMTSTDQLFESPNWHPDGRWIVVNADGLLYRVDTAEPAGLELIPMTGLPELNNDHLISPDGRWHYMSANDWHVYRAPWEGGPVERVTQEKDPSRLFRHFLHGITPDGRTLAYVGTEMLGGDEWGTRAIWLLDLDEGQDRLLGDGYSPADGPDFAPDGLSVYFNSEVASTREGHAQLFRHHLTDGTVQQLTDDDRVNWFPHPSPDGRWLAYLSYPPGTVGHPADLPVELRLIDLTTGRRTDLVALDGGQGTINVPSWSPDSRSLAYVAYPITDSSATGEVVAEGS
ncbi:TolB family protein [Trujillonella humicola]|uniref:TolB family protein n=1 Tax=Trujillonella humicola TaxID=3383699 RepID=UPI0039058324